MTKVLMRGIKPTEKTIGIFFRNLRFNRNILQREVGELLGLSQGQVSRIEHGKDGITEDVYNRIIDVFEITEEEKSMLQKHIVVKRQKTIDPLKDNLGDYVKNIIDKNNLLPYHVSKQIGKDGNLIGSIIAHNQPFRETEIEAFISTVKLNDVEAETLTRLNDYFEWQKKPNRDFTSQEKLIVSVVNGAKFKTPEERRKYIYSVRTQ